MTHSALHAIILPEGKFTAPYHGWETVGCFSSVEAEYDSAMVDGGMVDLSFIGRIRVTGADRVDLLHRLSTNNLLPLEPGTVRRTTFVTEKGRIVDTATVAVEQDAILLFISPNDEDRLIRWINKYTINEDVHLETVTFNNSTICLIGNKANTVASAYSGKTVASEASLTANLPAGVQAIVASSYAGKPAVYIVTGNEAAGTVWKNLAALAEMLSVPVIGSTAFELYRISMGGAGFPGEISEQFNPYEVRLQETISLSKGCYIGQEVIARLDTYQKVEQRLIGLKHSNRVTFVSGNPLIEKEQADVGVVTSSSVVPVRGMHLSLAVVRSSMTEVGDHVTIKTKNEPAIPAELVDLPIVA